VLQAVVSVILGQLWDGQVSQVHPRYQKDSVVPNNDGQLEKCHHETKKKGINLAEFGDIYEASEILQIGTFIIELAQAIVLSIKTLTERFKCFHIISPCIQGEG
jgi:hypothetical protein